MGWAELSFNSHVVFEMGSRRSIIDTRRHNYDAEMAGEAFDRAETDAEMATRTHLRNGGSILDLAPYGPPNGNRALWRLFADEPAQYEIAAE